MSEVKAAEAARGKLIEGFRSSMVGPGQEDELLRDTPRRTYVCGFLSPNQAVVEDEQNDEFQEGDKNASLEGVPSLVNAMWPSAMGLTFHVRRDVSRIKVSITGGFYEVEMVQVDASESKSGSGKKKSRGNPLKGTKKKENSSAKEAGGDSKEEVERWKRVPFEKTFTLDVDGPEEEKEEWTDMGAPGDGLYVDVRRFDHGKGKPRLLTLSLVNSNDCSDGDWQARELLTFFQPVIKVSAAKGEEAECFVEAPAVGSYRDDPDLFQHLLLYRNTGDFSTGHGCATDWAQTSDSHKTATAIWTEFIPTARVPDLHFEIFKGVQSDLRDKLIEAVSPACQSGDESEVIFTMNYLAGGGGRGNDWIITALNSLCDTYELWLENREEEIDAAIAEIQDESRREEVRDKAAGPNISSGKEILARMRAGITALESDEIVFRSFRLANEAMDNQLRMQRLQKLARDDKSPDSLEDLELPRWRPFQLAFILLTINSIADPELKLPDIEETERELMDLIWFPTGGGKTEAYLGLTAFTLFYRRLSRSDPDDGDGVSVITRYTLRLLTTQQFERAARLLCACEDLRCRGEDILGEKLELGSKEFSIGLWVGAGASPNRFKDISIRNADPIEGAVSIVYRINKGQKVRGTADVRHIQKCPWCGTEISNGKIDVLDESGRKITTAKDVKKEKRYRLRIRCKGSLPAPLTGKCQFSGDEGLPVRVVDEEIYANPPSVVIGTVDKFVRLAWDGETRSLFGRLSSGRKLPSPDLIIQDELHLISGPLGTMVGLFETAVDLIAKDENGISPKVVGSTATIRRAEEQAWGLFMRKVRQFPAPELTAGDSFFSRIDLELPGRKYMGIMAPGVSGKGLWLRCCGGLLQLASELEEGVRDPYWTLVCYFNSIRELSGGNVLAQDDVLRYMENLAESRKLQGKDSELRQIGTPKELTSRVRSGDISSILEELQQPYGLSKGSALDILLATNMISVGVDVDRLGLMMILGQPKTTSEYIQASSRVGRQKEGPGLILSISSWTRSRDRSHYERFVPYHKAFYREVEATSVTPWSGPARDRMLSAVLITALRQLDDRLAGTPNSLEDINEEELTVLLMPVVERVAALDPNEAGVAEDEIRSRIRKWKTWARQPDDVEYGNGITNRGTDKLLRSPVAPNGERDGLEAVPNSLRTVEPETEYRLFNL